MSDELRDDLRAGVVDILSGHADSARRRASMDASASMNASASMDTSSAMDTVDGYDRALHTTLSTELGISALVVPDELGGLGLDFDAAAMVIAELGRVLIPSPVPDTLVAATLLADRAVEPEIGTVLSTVAEGAADVAICGLTSAAGTGVTSTNGRLSGLATAVPFGATADLLLVISGTGADAAVHLVSPDQDTVRRTARPALDHTRRLADVEFSGAAASRVSTVDDAGALAVRLVGLAQIALAVESAAAASACLEFTVDYLKTREQFGRVLGSFQALKHRCADLAVAVDGAEATADYAAAFAATGEPVDQLGDEFGTVAALAKAVCVDTFFTVAADCLQLHGGVGFTYEHDLHLFLKRAKANQLLAGASSQLRAELAATVLSR